MCSNQENLLLNSRIIAAVAVNIIVVVILVDLILVAVMPSLRLVVRFRAKTHSKDIR